MKTSFFAEVILLSLLSVLSIFLLNPFNIIMKLMIASGVVTLLVILYVIKFVIIWKEKSQDERDIQHRFYSSWISYVVTSVLLFSGIVIESLQGSIDTWLIISITGLFITKLTSLVYLEVYR